MDVNHVSKSWHDPPKYGLLRLKKHDQNPHHGNLPGFQPRPHKPHFFHNFRVENFFSLTAKGGGGGSLYFPGFPTTFVSPETTYPKKGVSIVKPMKSFWSFLNKDHYSSELFQQFQGTILLIVFDLQGFF